MKRCIIFDILLIWSLSIMICGPAYAGDRSEENEKMLMDLGIACILSGKTGDAIAVFNKIIKINPANASAYDNRTYAHAMENDFLQAIADYSRAIELDPLDAEAYYNRGLLYDMHKDDSAKALADFNKALELDPDASDAYLSRGAVYARNGQYDKAVSDYNKAVKLDPKNGEIYYNRAVAYYRRCEYRKSWSDADQAGRLGFTPDPDFLKQLQKECPHDHIKTP